MPSKLTCSTNILNSVVLLAHGYLYTRLSRNTQTVLAALAGMSIIFYLLYYYEENRLFIFSWYNLYFHTIQHAQ